MIEDRVEELKRALALCYDDYPKSWDSKFSCIMEKLNNLPLVNGRPMPYITYFLYVHCNHSLATISYIDAVIADKIIEGFKSSCPGMEQAAAVLASVDFSNFKAEVEAFSNIQEAITNPHLDVSALYRYMAAVQEDYLFLITDELQGAAVKQLRENPYRYHAYGDHYLSLMPITWRGL